MHARRQAKCLFNIRENSQEARRCNLRDSYTAKAKLHGIQYSQRRNSEIRVSRAGNFAGEGVVTFC